MQNIFTNKLLQLHSGQVASLQLRQPLQLQVNCGLVWVTIDGIAADYWLTAGQSLTLPGRGLLVIEAVHKDSQILLSRCLSACADTPAGLAARIGTPLASATG